jgi:cytoplasmic iron level regulating protein YaaA (DUF328/UPF0246 family)
VASHPLLLLPPSAGKATGGTGDPWSAGVPHRFAGLVSERQAVRDAVDAQIRRGTQVTTMFGVSDRGLADALDMWRSMDDAPTLPACRRYTGVVWSALDPATLSTSGRRRLREWGIVVSGLWGLVGTDDPLPPYRLPIGARAGDLGGLAAYWRTHVGRHLETAAAGAWVFDLLPDDHAVAVADADIRRCRIRIVTHADGRQRAMGHAGKSLKGRLARAIVERGPRTPSALARVPVPGLTLLEATRDEVVYVAER